MKIDKLSVIASLFILVVFNTLAFSTENTPAEIVQNYFLACENGDVSAMKPLIADHFYQRRKVLIEENKKYSEFLKSHYSGMQIEIVSTEVESESGNAEVALKQIFPGGSSIDTTLVLKKNTDGVWKIVDEVLPE